MISGMMPMSFINFTEHIFRPRQILVYIIDVILLERQSLMELIILVLLMEQFSQITETPTSKQVVMRIPLDI